jgi:hypothetical protein
MRKSKTHRVPARVQRLSLFAPPTIIPGEDSAAYDQLAARLCAAVNPADSIEEMLTAEIATLQWEVVRWRRWKWNLLQERGLRALEDRLAKELDNDYDLFSDHFADCLTEVLQDNLPEEADAAQEEQEGAAEEEQEDYARALADRCARNEPKADDEVNKILDGCGSDMSDILRVARESKAKELVQHYVRRKPGALRLIHRLLAEAGTSIDALMAEALVNELDDVERIDHLAAMAEKRRDETLREMYRLRSSLGERVRRSVQEIEDADYSVIQPSPAKGENALDERPPERN